MPPNIVAPETVNHLPSTHFTFKISGLRVKSAAVVTFNQGDYGVAVDGQRIVKYTLVMETQDSSNNNVMHAEISIDVTHIHRPVDIEFPAELLKLQAPTPAS